MKPCRKCGSTDRYKSGPCKPCTKERDNLRNLEEYHKEWYEKNKEHRLAQIREYNKSNPEVIRKAQRNYQQRHKPKLAEKTARRRATNCSLVQVHKDGCKPYYELAKDCEVISGQKYHVDHIVPLNGKTVCGLHVPWNLQVLPSDINERKSNHYV